MPGMMRCSKEEHDKLFPKVKYEHQENQNLVGVQASIETLQVNDGIFAISDGTTVFYDLGPAGIQKSLDGIGRLCPEPYSHPGDSPEYDNRVRYKYDHRTGFWKRVR